MSRKKNKIYENVEITDIAAEGKALAKVDEIVFFVNNALPGDIVDIRVIRRRKNYKEATAIKFHKYSDLRIEPKCEDFETCGGCKWQNLPYEKQLEYKQQQVVDAIQRIGKIEPEKINQIIPSENKYFYRNKLEYTFSNRRWLTYEEIDTKDEIKNTNALGFHVPRMFDKIVDIKKCWLQPEPTNEIRLKVREFALQNNFTFYDIRNKVGLLRNLIIRTTTTGEFMVIVIFGEDKSEERKKLLDFIKENFPKITSLMYIINTKKNDSYADLDAKLFYGKDFIVEKIGELQFNIGAKSFFQTNTEQGHELYKIVKEFANFTGSEIVYDLYTGTGTIANFIAKSVKKVIGLEYIPEAIKDAIKNSEINKINNTSFFAGDMKDILNQNFIETNGRPDVIILDPPRAGVHKNVINAILYAKPEKIIYVSCKPETQARDIDLLKKFYELKIIQPVDMFPHTYHIENIALLVKKN